MRILVTNLTDSLRSVALPNETGRIVVRAIGGHETLDIATFVNPYEMDTAIGSELKALWAAKKVNVTIIPEPTDFSFRLNGNQSSYKASFLLMGA